MMLLLLFPFGGILGAAIAVIILVLLIKHINKRLQIGEKQINRDLKAFREELKKEADKLIPWNHEDLELLSLNLSEHRRRRGRHTTERGIIKNIYQEPSIAYVVKHYAGKDPKTLLVARGHDFEMVWVRNSSGVTIYKNQQHVGNITRDGKLLNAAGTRHLGTLKKSPSEDLLIELDDQLMASIRKTVDKDAVNPRAIDLIGQPDNNKKDAILALSLLDIIEVARKG